VKEQSILDARQSRRDTRHAHAVQSSNERAIPVKIATH
jgi:hypothetical protein